MTQPKPLKYYTGDTIKMISDSDYEGYLVAFTSEKKRDLHKQWFDQTTEFLLDVNPIVGKMVLFNHGLHKDIGSIPIGEFTHVRVDSKGIHVKAKDTFKANFTTYANNRAPIQTLMPAEEFKGRFLEEVDDYEKMLKELREAGYLKWSSGALPQSVVVDEKTGQILRWQIIEGSKTGTAAEPNGLTQITSKQFELLQAPYVAPIGMGIYSSHF